MKYLSLWIFLSILFGGRVTSVAAEWQWSVQIPSMISQETEAHPQAFLWIPDDCGQVKAVVVGQHNMCEETLFENPLFRKRMQEAGVALVWITPILDFPWNVTTGCNDALLAALDDLAETSGYDELKAAPIVPLGHSAMATFPWNFAAWNPERTLAIISYHGDAPRTNLTGYGGANLEWGRTRNIDGIPGLMVEGEYEWWEYRSSVITGLTQDSLYNILGVCQSIQRYKTAEQEMREARDKALQADKLKSAFLANMSHEIRTPLNAIVGFSDLLSDTSGFTSEEIAQFIGTINKNCGLLLALINDILDLSRIESGTMEFMFAEHNLPLLLKTVHDSQRLNMPPGVELVLRMPESDKKYLTTDNVRLQQVVNNLINNAAKFTSSGFITFGYEDDEVPGYTRIFVEDTGVGISEEGIRHIFERFYKVDNFTQGAGLGLSICQTIIERLNGTISVTSEVGKGTRFTVRLPNYCE